MLTGLLTRDPIDPDLNWMGEITFERPADSLGGKSWVGWDRWKGQAPGAPCEPKAGGAGTQHGPYPRISTGGEDWEMTDQDQSPDGLVHLPIHAPEAPSLMNPSPSASSGSAENVVPARPLSATSGPLGARQSSAPEGMALSHHSWPLAAACTRRCCTSSTDTPLYFPCCVS